MATEKQRRAAKRNVKPRSGHGEGVLGASTHRHRPM